MAKRWINKKRIISLLVLVGVLVSLEYLPGSYTIDSFQDEFALDSVEGQLLLALEDLQLNAVMEFDRPTRQRISKNAELLIPAGSTLILNASMVPLTEQGEAVAKPRTWNLRSSESMTFVYRGVTVARAKRMEIRNDDPELKVKAVGSYRVLSALATATRYHRQTEVKRTLEAPERAVLNLNATFQAEHEVSLTDIPPLRTGSEPSSLHLQGFTWENSQWTDGQVDLRIQLAPLESFLNEIAKEQLSDPIELGGILAIKFRRLHALTIEENRTFVHLDGSITSANSRTVEQMFDASFETRLEFEFSFPEGKFLQEAEVGARLKQIHSFDINRSNTVFDKAVRSLARKYRDDLTYTTSLADELPDHPAIPMNLIFERFGFRGMENGDMEIEILGNVPPFVPNGISSETTQSGTD